MISTSVNRAHRLQQAPTENIGKNSEITKLQLTRQEILNVIEQKLDLQKNMSSMDDENKLKTRQSIIDLDDRIKQLMIRKDKLENEIGIIRNEF